MNRALLMLIFIVGLLGSGMTAMANEDPKGEGKNWTYTGFFSQQLNQVSFSIGVGLSYIL